MLQYFEIHTPMLDNSGQDQTANHREFTQRLFNVAEGYNSFQVNGNWRDNTGKEYPEEIRVYRVALDPGLNVWRYETIPNDAEHLLRAITKECFPDQKAIAIARIGTMTIE